MGFNRASTIETALPIVQGDTVVAPGSYRVNIARPAEDKIQLVINGGGMPTGGADASFPGKLGKQKKPTKKLNLAWAKDKKAKAGKFVNACFLHVNFGKDRLSMPMRVVAPTKQKAKGYQAMSFNYPADWLKKQMDADKSTPILSLVPKKKPKKGQPTGFNLIVSKSSAKLVPHMQAPTDSFGFGAVKQPDAKWSSEGQISWKKGQGSSKALTIRKLTVSKKKIEIQLDAGDRTASLSVPMPTGK